MLTSAHRKFLTVGFVVIVVIVALHAAPSRFNFFGRDDLYDLAHVCGFAALSFFTLVQLRRMMPGSQHLTLRPWLLAAIIATAVAVVSEGAQLLTSRNASMGDMLRDASGIAAGLLIASSFNAERATKILLFLAGLGSLTAGLAEPAGDLTAKLAALRRMPVILDFEDALQPLIVNRTGIVLDVVPAPPGFSGDGHVARVLPGRPVDFPTVRFSEPPPDWSGYQTLSFRVATIDAEAAQLTIRVDDYSSRGRNDRFIRQVPIAREPQTIRIPLEDIRKSPENRELDLSRIDRMLWYMPQAEFVGFYFDDLKLE